MQHADELWIANCLPSGGLSTGEGLIHAVRDKSIIGKTKKGEPIFDDGVIDKRLCVVESELARTFHALLREGNTLGAVLCQAWDGNQMRTMTRNTPRCATGAHVSIVGHVTASELIERLQRLQNSVGKGGLGNRILWVLARRQRSLPFGGRPLDAELQELGRRLGAAIKAARLCADNVTLDPSARALWARIYPDLTADRPGLLGSMTQRGAPQVRRIATVYALLDHAREVADVHLHAALELWRYCIDSARFLFGESTGDKVADRILGELRGIRPDWLPRAAIGKLFGWNTPADAIERALTLLVNLGLAQKRTKPTGRKGRPPEEWGAV
jgi:hypothetical protein